MRPTMETRPRHDEEHLRQLAESVREVFWIFTPDLSETIYVNRAYEEIFGRPVESLYREPTSFLHAVHPEDRKRVAKALARVLTKEQTVEYRIVCPDGAARWLRVRGFPVRDAEGRTFRILGVAEDVTERKRAEEAQRFLAEAGEILSSSLDYEETLQRVARLAVQQTADWAAVFVVDEESGAVQRVEVAHGDPEREPLAERLRDRPVHPGHPILEVIRKAEPLLLEHVPDSLLGSVAHDPEDETMLRSLGIRSGMAVPLVAGGRVLGAMYFVSAESGRRYRAEDLALAEDLAHLCALAVDNARHYERAQQALRTREQVLALVSHDLANPLQAISFTTSALLGGSLPETDQARHLRVIDRATNRMIQLIRDLLDVTRIETGDLPLEPFPLDVGALLAEACELFHPRTVEKSLRLVCEPPVEAVRLRADYHRLLQALSNLIGNAFKFTPEGGEIRVRAARAGDAVRFEVSDTGIGIEAELLPRLFERFWQARHTHRGGAGLGLAIVRGIVEAHGGSVTVESTPGQGSTFVFTVPGAVDRAGSPAA